MKMTSVSVVASFVLTLCVLEDIATADDGLFWSHLFGGMGDIGGWTRGGGDSREGGGWFGARPRNSHFSQASKQVNNQKINQAMTWHNGHNGRARKGDASHEESVGWRMSLDLPATHEVQVKRGELTASNGWNTGTPQWGRQVSIIGKGGDSSQEDGDNGPAMHGLWGSAHYSSHKDSRGPDNVAPGHVKHDSWGTEGGEDSSQEDRGGFPMMHHIWNTDGKDSSPELYDGPVMHNVWDTSGGDFSHVGLTSPHFWEDSSRRSDSGPVFHNIWTKDAEGADSSQEHLENPVLPWEIDGPLSDDGSLDDDHWAGERSWRDDSADAGNDDAFLHQSGGIDSSSESASSRGGNSEAFRPTSRRTPTPSSATSEKTTDTLKTTTEPTSTEKATTRPTTTKQVTTRPTTTKKITNRPTTSKKPSTASTTRRIDTTPTSITSAPTSTISSTTTPRTSTTTTTTTSLPTTFPGTKCQEMMDVAVVVHLPDTMTYDDLQLLHLSLQRLLDHLKVAPNGRHVSVLGYSDQVLLQTPLSGDSALLKSSIQRLRPHTGSAETALALHHMIDMMLQQGRPGVPKACILLTDEDSSDGRQAVEQAARARKIGIQMMVVGIGAKGALNLHELRSLAGDAHHLVLAESFADLENALVVVVLILCPASSSTTRLTTSETATTFTPKPNTQSTVTTTSVETSSLTTSVGTVPSKTMPVSSTRKTVSTARVTQSDTTTPQKTRSTQKTTSIILTTAKPTIGTTRPIITSPRTTPSTIMTSSTTPPVAVPAICDNCTMVNGVGYKAHWAHCDLFIQCQFLPDGTVSVRIKQCPHGLHWDQAGLSCTRPAQAGCTLDPCRQTAYRTYPATNNCRGYWLCESGRSEGKCCPPGYSFSGRIGCVPDPQCQDTCGVSPYIPPDCDKRAVPQMPLTFEQYVPGAGWQLMFCAPGTAYNHTRCACTDMKAGPADPNTCRAELYLPFKGDIKDESGNNNFVQNEGVKVISGAGYFDGNSVLRVPRFANADYGDYVLIRLRYKQDAGGGGKQALVANGDCLKPSSLYMVADQQGVSFGAQTTSGKNASVTVPDATGGWKEAVMYVDRHTLTGSVNNFSMQTLFTGSLATSKCALQIGRGTNFQHFKGFMDDIKVYLCRPKTF